MATNILGFRGLLKYEKVDSACAAVVAGTFTKIGCVKTQTPPGRMFGTFDDSCLDDTVDSEEVGAEIRDRFVANIAFDPGDAEHLDLDAMMTNGCGATWQVQHPSWTKAIQFDGKIERLKPVQMDRKTIVAAEITIVLRSAITYPNAA